LHRILKGAQGQTASEYTIIGALLIVAALGGLSLLGSTISDQLSGILGHTEPTHTVQVGSVITLGNTVTGHLNNTPDSPGTAANHQTGGSTVPEDPNLPQGLSNTIQTLGANGTTELLAQKLETLAKTLLADGQITQAQSDLLMQLANQGHSAAQIEGLVESYVNAGGPAKAGATIQYDGQAYTPLDLTKLVGYQTYGPLNGPNPLTPSKDSGAVMAKFQTLYQQVQTSGLLSNPDVKAVVDNAASQIVMIGELVDNSYYEYQQNQLKTKQPDFFEQSLASTATNLKSADICSSGNFKDTLTMCQ
jgi:hypothetical protein